MRTSPMQFELLLSFMEQHGDLNKTSSDPQTRAVTWLLWDELAKSLNDDPSGYSKSVDKWKKVWSDLKNNTKKKAARIRQIKASGDKSTLRITDLESRVLNLLDLRTCWTDLIVDEAGLAQEQLQLSSSDEENKQYHPPLILKTKECLLENPDSNTATLVTPLNHPSYICTTEDVQSSQPPLGEHDPLTLLETAESEPEYNNLSSKDADSSPVRPLFPLHVVQPLPARSGHTRHRHVKKTRIRRPARPRLRSSEQAVQKFHQAKGYWRTFKMTQHQDYMELRREQNRIREMEVQTQRQWQEIGLKALNILDKLVNKYCKG